MHLIKKYGLVAAGILVGLSGGYLYWQQIGCVTGSCPITSSPVNSSLYGAMMGGLLFSMFKKEKNQNTEK
ncbi:MAG: DUF6132 family protein [Bacteroidota bacterium]